MKQMATEFAEDFIITIAANRGEKLKTDRTEWGTGKEYYAEKALTIGLIDSIDTFENVLNYFNT